jgi:hypothetical protein
VRTALGLSKLAGRTDWVKGYCHSFIHQEPFFADPFVYGFHVDMIAMFVQDKLKALHRTQGSCMKGESSV